LRYASWSIGSADRTQEQGNFFAAADSRGKRGMRVAQKMREWTLKPVVRDNPMLGWEIIPFSRIISSSTSRGTRSSRFIVLRRAVSKKVSRSFLRFCN